jgi:hypothetical protein
MTATYEKHGLKFLYPENWKLTDGQDIELPYQVEIEAPCGGIWSVNVFPGDADADELLADAVKGLQDTYEDMEIADAEADFTDFDSRGVDAYFYCLDFLVMARIRVIATERYKLVLLFQAESRDFEGYHDVFRAITTSLLQSI